MFCGFLDGFAFSLPVSIFDVFLGIDVLLAGNILHNILHYISAMWVWGQYTGSKITKCTFPFYFLCIVEDSAGADVYIFRVHFTLAVMFLWHHFSFSHV